MTNIKVKGLKKRWNTYYVEKRLPADVRAHFGRARFSRSLKTHDISEAAQLAITTMKDWDALIAAARLVVGGENLDLNHLVETHQKRFAAATNKIQVFAEAAHDMGLDPDYGTMAKDSQTERVILTGLAETTGQLTPVDKYVDEFQAFIKYIPYTAAESRRFITEKFSSEFKYFEEITSETLKDYVQRRLSGSDGKKPWAEVTLKKNLGFMKSYWKYCVSHQGLSATNKIVYDVIIPETPNTKAHRQKTRKKEANHAYSVEECWRIHDAAANKTGKQNELLADLILLGMYTGCRLNELCSLELTDVTDDRISLPDSKTDAGERDIPIHRDIQQVIERLKQTSTDGFLFSGLTCNNEFNDRSKSIGQRYGRLKRKLGFTDKVHTFHSFRSTLATQLLNAGVPLEFAARIIGHSNPEGVKNNLTFGHYAGELAWKNKVEAMAKVKYK